MSPSTGWRVATPQVLFTQHNVWGTDTVFCLCIYRTSIYLPTTMCQTFQGLEIKQ